MLHQGDVYERNVFELLKKVVAEKYNIAVYILSDVWVEYKEMRKKLLGSGLK